MKTELIIPTHDNDGSDNAEVIRKAITTMCATFGGATVFEATGYWTNEAGRLFEDRVKVITSAATANDETTAKMRELAKAVLAATDQEAVFVSVGGKAEIIE